MSSFDLLRDLVPHTSADHCCSVKCQRHLKMDASTAAIAANLSHIAKFEAKLPPPALPETAVTEAFGAWAYPKIVRHLNAHLMHCQAFLPAVATNSGHPCTPCFIR